MKALIILLTALFTFGCSSTDVLRVASIGTILVSAESQVIAATNIVTAEFDKYSEEDQAKLKGSYDKLSLLYKTAASYDGNRKLMLTNLVSLIPSAKVNATIIYEVLDRNLANLSPEGRTAIEELLYSMSVLNAEYDQLLAVGDAKKIRDASLVYLRAFSPILLQIAKAL